MYCSHYLATAVVYRVITLQRVYMLQYKGDNTARTMTITGARGRVVVGALCYKPEGRGIAFR
jgi:hypothetical protein